MKLLPLALSGNAVFSSISGVLLATLSRSIAAIFEASSPIPFLLVGVGLLFFAYTIWIEIKPQRPGKVMAIIIQDLLWVLASIVILIIRPFHISEIGYAIIAWIAGCVLLFAILQAWGWWKKPKLEA
ncbi:MAG: hypothetical protein KTR30_03550 [Saprospiraceae bacterium]|nr:hypothetical protein [Saprospiraceae bacterium]